MAMGLPVAATRVDGVPEVVENDVSGLLCSPKDAQSLLVALQDMIMDSALRKRLGAAAKHVVTGRFKLMDMLAAYEKAYHQLDPAGAKDARPS